jgi:uncharacterized protein (DUF2237 family)
MQIKARMEMSDEARDALDAQKQVDKIVRKFKKAVTDLDREIVKTAPVDTGYYRAGWILTFSSDGSKAEICNPVNYAEYLIYGTRRIAGALSFGRASYSRKAIKKRAARYPRADLSRGILHDVRAIIYEWKEKMADVMVRDEE